MTTDTFRGTAVPMGAPLIEALLREQHPDLAHLPIVDAGGGWDNRLYRLGDDLVARLPQREPAAALIAHEQRWLPVLAGRLPLPIPLPLRAGRPGRGFSWAWSITAWFEGEDAIQARLEDAGAAAIALGAFLAALHQPAPPDAPRNPFRGVPLADRSATVHERVRQLHAQLDAAAVLALWDRLARTPAWTGPPLWLHGDLHPGNLLVRHGRLAAVIDFGDLTAGDPAADLSIAWMLLPRAARPVFRACCRGSIGVVDDDTWQRARGWALALGLTYLAEAWRSEALAAVGRATVAAVIADDFGE